MLAGEGKAAVRPPEETLLLIVHEGGISPALLSALHLEVVKEPGVPLPLLGIGESSEPSHTRIVRDRGPASTGIWRLFVHRASMSPVHVGKEFRRGLCCVLVLLSLRHCCSS